MHSGALSPAFVVAAAVVLSSACGDNNTGGGAADGRVLDAPIGAIDSAVGAVDAGAGAIDAAPDAAENIVDAGVPDAFDGDAGLTVVKTFSFATDTDGFVAGFTAPGTAMVWHSDDGDPPGSLAFTANRTDPAEVALKATFAAAVTWETWGVPPGATVVAVRVKSYKSRLAEISGGIDHHFSVQIVSPANAVVHDGLDTAYLELASLPRSPQATFATVGPRDRFSVLAPFRASNQMIFPKLWYTPVNTGTTDWRLDELQLEITYVNP